MDIITIRQQLECGKSIFELPLRVACYARVSTDKEDQLNSLANQTSYYENYIRQNKCWIYAGAYIDEGVSGTSVSRRDSFLRMISDARECKFDLIITKEISRFSRNTLDSISYTRQLLQYGVGVYFQNDNINTLTGDAELRLTIMASLAQDEVRRLSERVRFGFRQAQEQRVVLGNDNTFGYRKSGGKLEIVESEAEIVRAIFSRYIEGSDGLRRIANQLERDGIVSHNGKPFTYSTLYAIITNPKYKGWYAGRKYVTDDYRTKKVIKRRREDWLCERDESIPAIVSEEVWDKANRLLDERGRKLRESGGSFSARYRYSGKLICADHDTAYHRHVITNKSGSRECWSCKIYRQKGKSACNSPTIYSDELDAVFSDVFARAAIDRDKIVSELLHLYESESSDDSALKTHESELSRIRQKKEKLLELALDGMLTNAEFKVRNDELTAKSDELSEKISRIKSMANSASYKNERIHELGEKLHCALSDGSIERGELTDTLLDHITVKRMSDTEVKLSIVLKSGADFTESGNINGTRSILSYETGISQAQVSRLEKGALERIRKQLV